MPAILPHPRKLNCPKQKKLGFDNVDVDTRGSASSAEQIAASIYDATTDGKGQLRYLLGDDAKQNYAMREQVGDDAFMAGMRERMLS